MLFGRVVFQIVLGNNFLWLYNGPAYFFLLIQETLDITYILRTERELSSSFQVHSINVNQSIV